MVLFLIQKSSQAENDDKTHIRDFTFEASLQAFLGSAHEGDIEMDRSTASCNRFNKVSERSLDME